MTALLCWCLAAAATPAGPVDWRAAVAAELATAGAPKNLSEERQALRGLDPEQYLRRRRPEPEAVRELERWATYATPSLRGARLADEIAHDFPSFAPSPATAFAPWRLDGPTIARLQAAESRAWRSAVLLALAKTAHPRAAEILAAVLADPAHDLTSRARAAQALGRSRAVGAERPLVELAQNQRAPIELRQAAADGLGALRTPTAARALASLAAASVAPGLRPAATAALGQIASSWLPAAAAEAEAAQALATAALVRLLGDDSTAAFASTVIEAASAAPRALLVAGLEGQGSAGLSEAARARIAAVLARQH